MSASAKGVVPGQMDRICEQERVLIIGTVVECVMSTCAVLRNFMLMPYI